MFIFDRKEAAEYDVGDAENPVRHLVGPVTSGTTLCRRPHRVTEPQSHGRALRHEFESGLAQA